MVVSLVSPEFVGFLSILDFPLKYGREGTTVFTIGELLYLMDKFEGKKDQVVSVYGYEETINGEVNPQSVILNKIVFKIKKNPQKEKELIELIDQAFSIPVEPAYVIEEGDTLYIICLTKEILAKFDLQVMDKAVEAVGAKVLFEDDVIPIPFTVKPNGIPIRGYLFNEYYFWAIQELQSMGRIRARNLFSGNKEVESENG